MKNSKTAPTLTSKDVCTKLGITWNKLGYKTANHLPNGPTIPAVCRGGRSKFSELDVKLLMLGEDLMRMGLSLSGRQAVLKKLQEWATLPTNSSDPSRWIVACNKSDRVVAALCTNAEFVSALSKSTPLLVVPLSEVK